MGRVFRKKLPNDAEQRGTANYLETILQQLVLVEHAKTKKEKYASLDTLLAFVGAYAKADRAFIFEILQEPDALEQPDIFTNTVEWCAEGVKPQKDYLQLLHVGEMPYWYQTFCVGKHIIIKNLEDVRRHMPHEYAILKTQDVHSGIAYPIFHEGTMMGFIGLNNPRVSRMPKCVNLMEIVSRYLGISWSRHRANEHLQMEHSVQLQKKRELERGNLYLEILCQEYTSVYYVNLRTGMAEVIKLNMLANAARFISTERDKLTPYMPALRNYVNEYVTEGGEQILTRLDPAQLRQALQEQERLSVRYRSIPNTVGQQYFEIQAIRVTDETDDFGVMLGFRYIDHVIALENRQKAELQRALDETRMSNEVVSTISKIYFSIFCLDLPHDMFEEISSDNKIHRLTGRTGVASDKLKELCNTIVVPQYYDAIMRFFDLKTLPKRLQEDDTIAIEYLAKDGNWHLTRFIAKERDESGQVTQAMCVTQLVSEAKRHEQNLIAAAEEAKRENETKTEFLSCITHDIRTPMNAVRGFTALARANLHNPDKIRHSLDQIDIAGRYLQQLVDDVLDLTRLEQGEMPLHIEKISIQKIFTEIKETVLCDQMDKHLQTSFRMHDIVHDCVMTDELHLCQIYINLLSNALKYTPDGGEVSFEIYQAPADDANKVRLISVIRDNGIGMTPEYMKKMYNRFSRAVDTRVNKVRGSGLGLSLVKELVDLLGGTIAVKSQPGKGTEFTVVLTLEYVLDAAEEPPKPEQEDIPRCDGMHLLSAEDNDLNYEVEKELLEMYGVTCDRAENGAVCVQMFQNTAPGTYDAILMDMQMPIMDGIQATTAIRNLEQPDAQTIPIIALTANAFPADAQNCLAAGMNLHLTKPLNVSQLMRALSMCRKKKTDHPENP